MSDQLGWLFVTDKDKISDWGLDPLLFFGSWGGRTNAATSQDRETQKEHFQQVFPRENIEKPFVCRTFFPSPVTTGLVSPADDGRGRKGGVGESFKHVPLYVDMIHTYHITYVCTCVQCRYTHTHTCSQTHRHMPYNILMIYVYNIYIYNIVASKNSYPKVPGEALEVLRPKSIDRSFSRFSLCQALQRLGLFGFLRFGSWL